MKPSPLTSRIVSERGATEPPPRPAVPPEADRLRAIEGLLRFNIGLNAENENGRLLLMDARGATLDLLLRHGADPRRASADGWTALHAAVGSTKPEDQRNRTPMNQNFPTTLLANF